MNRMPLRCFVLLSLIAGRVAAGDVAGRAEGSFEFGRFSVPENVRIEKAVAWRIQATVSRLTPLSTDIQVLPGVNGMMNFFDLSWRPVSPQPLVAARTGLAADKPGTGVILSWMFGALTLLSMGLLLWQWLVARRFPLNQRVDNTAFAPPVTLLKPLKGCDDATEDCLRSWFQQQYPGEMQVLFAVASTEDPVCAIVRRLIGEFPQHKARLVICPPLVGANAKVAKLAELEKLAQHEVLVISDADVRVPEDFLANAVAPLRDDAVGAVTCFYRLANPTTAAMRCEAVAVNGDFWSQVLQARSLKPLDFALGAAMLTRRKQLAEIGGFQALADHLADDYQLGNRIARRGYRIALCPVVVECWDPPMTWPSMWKHQLRWARTIRVSRPVPYFFSILSNVTLWAVLCAAASAGFKTVYDAQLAAADHSLAVRVAVIQLSSIAILAGAAALVRIITACELQRRMTGSSDAVVYGWLVPVNDMLQALLWLASFLGNDIAWRGRQYRLRRDGTLKASQ